MLNIVFKRYFLNNYAIVILMKNIKVVAAVIINNKKVFATQRGYGEYKDRWEFPGGKIEIGETPEDALKREIFEELETTIEVKEKLKTIEYDYPTFHISMYCYLCTIVEGALFLKEHEASRWLTKDELYSVNWLDADLEVLDIVSNLLN